MGAHEGALPECKADANHPVWVEQYGEYEIQGQTARLTSSMDDQGALALQPRHYSSLEPGVHALPHSP